MKLQEIYKSVSQRYAAVFSFFAWYLSIHHDVGVFREFKRLYYLYNTNPHQVVEELEGWVEELKTEIKQRHHNHLPQGSSNPQFDPNDPDNWDRDENLEATIVASSQNWKIILKDPDSEKAECMKQLLTYIKANKLAQAYYLLKYLKSKVQWPELAPISRWMEDKYDPF